MENKESFANFYKYVINKNERAEVAKMAADPGYSILMDFIKDVAERKIPIDCLEKAKTEADIKGYKIARDYIRVIVQFLRDRRNERFN